MIVGPALSNFCTGIEDLGKAQLNSSNASWLPSHFLLKGTPKTIGANHCAILNVSVIAEIAEIKEMGEQRRSLFNWRDVNVGIEWGNGPFCAKHPIKN